MQLAYHVLITSRAIVDGHKSVRLAKMRNSPTTLHLRILPIK